MAGLPVAVLRLTMPSLSGSVATSGLFSTGVTEVIRELAQRVKAAWARLIHNAYDV